MDDIQSWWEVPSIAHFCSLFRAAFNLLDFDIEELEEALLTDGTEDSGSSLLQELMVRLLAGCVPSAQGCISIFNYQMFLRRLFRQKCQEYGRDNPFNTDMDFQFLPLRSKVEILHALCDFRLDADDVQDLLKNLESDSLRVEPLGHDESNSAYWYFYGTRLYREDYPKIKKGVQERKRKIRDDKRKRTRRKKKKGAAAAEEEEEEEELASDGENEDACLKSRTGAGVKWQVVCFSESDWEALTERLHGSTSPPEKALHRTLAEDFLPEIPRLFAEKERLQRKRIQESQPRRTSGRIEKLRKQQQREAALMEEEERNMGRGNALARINEDSLGDMDNERIVVSGGEDEDDLDESKEEENKRLVEEEEKERLFQCYLAREERVTRAFLRSLSSVQGERIILGPNMREESSSESSLEDISESKRRKSPRVKRRDKHKGRGRGAAGGNRSEGSKDGLPVGRQTNNSLSSATGPIIIQTSRRKLKSSQVFRQSDEDLQTGLHKILERVKSHEDAWPFADPVDEEWAPRYYAVVRKPMHLRRMEEKLEAGEYLSFSHFKADFMLIVDNCRKYNGSDNEYTEMVENLREVFQRAADRYLESDLSSDEDVAVEFPPPAGAVPGSLPGAEGGAVGGEESPPPRLKKEDPEEAAEQEEDLPIKEELSEGRRRRKRLRGGNSWKEGESKRRLEEESANEEEKIEEKISSKEKELDKKEERREEKRKQDKRKEEKKEERKEERKEEKKRKEEERKKEEEVEREKEKKGKADKESKTKAEEAEGREIEEREKGKMDERKEEVEEERFGSHRKRRKKLSDDDGNEKKRKGQSGRERGRRGVDTEEEVLEEKKQMQESAPATEEDEEGGNTSGGRKKDSLTGSKKNKNKPKKQGVVRNAAAIDALAEATEQTLKDINKWLDDTPRFSEFSSASNSPSHLLSAEEFDAVGKGIESEYRRSLRMCDSSLAELQQKDHIKKEAGPMGDKKVIRIDKRKPGQGSGVPGTVPAPKRTIIERLQPGKSKGNLLKQGRSNSDVDTGASGGGVLGVGSVTDEPSKKPGETTPKLSLGSVLRGDIAFGEVAKKESEEGVDEEEEEKVLQVGGVAKKEKKQEEEKVEVVEKFEEEKNVRKKMGSATPNLSAWFKAFGAPKGQGQRKKGPEEGKAGTPQEEIEKTNTTEDVKPPTEEAKKVLPEDDAGTTGKVDPEPMSPSPSGTPHSNSGRQRHVSTGSSNVSDLSSAFSPDVVDPALSPRLVELPSHSPSASIPPPLPSTFSPVNGTIRVGFYQDTSQKSGGSVGSNGGVEEGLPSPTHSGSSSLSLPQSSVPMQSSDMQFYDTSKPLTDQYREVAARVHHQHHPPSAPTPPPVSPSPPPPVPPASPPRPITYPTTTPSVIFSTCSNRVTSPTYLSPVVYPPPASTAVTSYVLSNTTTTTTTSFPASDSGATTTFPVKKRLYASASVSSTANTPLPEGGGSSVLVAPPPTCSSPVGQSYHSPEPQVTLVQRTAPLVLPGSPPPYDCSTQRGVPGYPHAHLQAPQSKLAFQRLPIYHHHPELTQLHPPHPEKPEPLRSVLHHPPHTHPSHSPHTSEVQPSSPPRPVEPMIPYPVEHQRPVLDLRGSTSTIQPTPAPPTRTKTKTSRKTKAVRQQQQRQEQQSSETHVGPVTTSGFQQFTRKSPEPMATGLQQPQHPPSSAFEFAANLTLYGRDEKDFQHHYLRAPTLPPPSSGYYVDPGSMVKSSPPSPHQQPQQQHSQPLPQGCPPQATVGSALPSYPFPISPHYPHYHHPHHHHHLEAVPPTKSQYLPSPPPAPSSTASPTTVSSPSPTTSASPIAAPSIPASLLSTAPPSFHPPNLSPLPPTLPPHRGFCPSGNSRAPGSGILAFQQGQPREGGSGMVAGNAPPAFAVDAAHTNPLYQQYHHHTHPHHLHPPPHHIPQEELLLRGAAPPLAPAYPSGYPHAFDAINRPLWR